MNISHETPNSNEYIKLRKAVGLGSMDNSVADIALKNSLFSVIVRGEDSKLMAMGRIIGDGACYFQIVDIVVHPSHQEPRLEEMIIKELLAYLANKASKDADILVIADVAKIKMYQRLGFKLIYPEFYGMSIKM
ncbi:GNAT family N-acetyltransferase [Paenibacillus sp. N3/727]|uniref:GNAT family N-acetyltransferase n=1 Tax=Paenibacillus sp. N3/727 TaxID=2925845 RepID=UPI001F52C188|nr:GNAT family N-acetyltransferase [Paenibacillus sp. N3/727]UNK16376.1 GNAT family N-acetyltransferase [Paenibacillus sp. N3/727]